MPDTNPTPVDVQRILAEHLRSIFVAPGCGTTSLRLRNSPDKLAESLALALALAGYEIIPARTAIPGPDTITVNREALRLLRACTQSEAWKWAHKIAMSGESTYGCDAIGKFADEVLAALSEPPVPKEQQP